MIMFDVVEAILFRLPVEDLLRCKSVCKSWKSLISSPSFAKTHAKFVCNKEEGRKIDKIPLYKNSINYDQIPDEWKVYSRLRIQGSSNGLVFCVNHPGPRLYVTNPVTRELREVTQPPKRIPGERRCYGFGYDSSTDDYKVFMAICHPGQTVVSILSLKSNVWNIFAGQVNYCFYHDGWLQKPGILLYGALNWFWYDANEKPLIVSFDLAKEEFKEIPQPHDTRYVWNMGCTLGIMNGRLCIYPYYDNSTSFPSCGTWVMKNYHHLNPSWELLSKDSQMNNHAIHHLPNIYYPTRSEIMSAYSCDDNIQLSRSKEYIPSPIFVKTVVSPFVNNNNNGGPSHAKDNKSTANAGSVKEKREMEEVDRVVDVEKENKIVPSLLEVEGGAELIEQYSRN